MSRKSRRIGIQAGVLSGRNKKYGYGKKTSNFKVNLTLILVIIVMSVLAGYATTKYFIYPIILGQEPEKFDFLYNISNMHKADELESNVDDNAMESTEKDEGDIISDDLDIEMLPDERETAVSSQGYCIQYGSFSSDEGAKELQKELAQNGIKASVIQKDGSYKVIGETMDTREAAETEKGLQQAIYEDAFIIEK